MSGSDDEKSAESLEFVLSGRPARLNELMLGAQSPEDRAAIFATEEALAALALAAPPLAPKASVKAKLMATLTARSRVNTAPRKAVLVVDMINDHLSPGRPLYVPRACGIVSELKARLEEARAQGVPVVYVLDRHEAFDPELDAWGAHAIEGTEGAAVWPALAPQQGDHEVTKPSFSAFFGSKLESVLDALHVDTLVLTGCATEVQLLATATDALQRGYAVELPAETQAGASEVAEQVTMGVLSALVPYQPARRARLARFALLEAPAI